MNDYKTIPNSVDISTPCDPTSVGWRWKNNDPNTPKP